MNEKQAAIGDRVIAISHNDGPVVYIFGYGTFEGYFLPPFVDLTEAVKEVQADYRDAQTVIPDLPAVLTDDAAATMLLLEHANPRIKLEPVGDAEGKSVWGYECWWRPAESFDNLPKPDGFRVEVIDIDIARAQAKAAQELDDVEELTPEVLMKSFKEIN
jgi:hypothetical protein